MNRRVDLPGSVRNVLGGLFGVLGHLFRSAWLMLVPKAVLVAKLLAAQSQLAACVDAVSRKQAPKPRFTPKFRGATSGNRGGQVARPLQRGARTVGAGRCRRRSTA